MNLTTLSEQSKQHHVIQPVGSEELNIVYANATELNILKCTHFFYNNNIANMVYDLEYM